MTVAAPVRVINLQLFAEERQFPATPRRRQEARRRGQVFRSLEVSSAVILLGGLATLQFFGPYIYGRMTGLIHEALVVWTRMELTTATVSGLAGQVVWTFLLAVLPLLGVLAVLGLAVNAAQTGLVWSVEPLAPRLSRINPLEGARRIFSRRALFELGKSLLKVALVAAVTYGAFRTAVESVVARSGADVRSLAAAVGSHALGLGWRAALVLAVVAALDYLYQRYEYEQSLKMTRQEIKEELRQTEGDPLVRRRIRERQRRIASQRMMQQVPTADVVITNPTHVAVALRYDAATMEAPVVVAKGAGYVARRIREVAMEHGVVVVEDVWLARTLYQSADIGDPIPENLYRAVARVLAFAYRVGRRRPARA